MRVTGGIKGIDVIDEQEVIRAGEDAGDLRRSAQGDLCFF
jgi:hypothetical protein